MKKILIALFVLMGVVGYANDDANDDVFIASLVDHEIKFQCSESAVGDYNPTLSDVKWLSGTLPKGYVVFGYGEIFDEYIYSLDNDGCPICRYKKSDLNRDVVYTNYIPSEYGNGKVYKLDNGMSFKIVKFKPNGKAKFDMYSHETRKFVNSKNCYVLIVMNASGAVKFSCILKKTMAGFRDENLVSYEQPMKVSKLGVLLTSCTIGPDECTLDDGVKWILGEDRLVLNSVGTQNGRSEILAEACSYYYVAQTYKVFNPPVTDRGLYDVTGPVKTVKEENRSMEKFTKEGKLILPKGESVSRDKKGRIIGRTDSGFGVGYEYDSAGNVAYKISYIDGEYNISQPIEYSWKYDQNRNIIEETLSDSFNSDFNTKTYKYQSFDKFGNWTKRHCRISGPEIDSDSEYEYEFTYVETCERVYDKYGNWTKMTTTRKAADKNKDNPYLKPEVETRSRKITYYKASNN